MAAIAAPRPQPPKRNCCVVDMPGVTGRIQRVGLCVGSSPSHSGASTENNLGGDRVGPCHIGADLGFRAGATAVTPPDRSEEHTSELQSLMRISYAVFCLK